MLKKRQKNDQPRRGIYLLPNLFTMLGLFAGFYAIVAAMRGVFDDAIIAVYVAMVADAIDGRVARLTNTQSSFGAQLDSLADMIGFGAAPALVAYSLGLHGLGKFGWLAAFCYTAATALRLARFNIQIQADKRYFIGLPCPAAAGLLVSLMWIVDALAGHEWAIIMMALTAVLSAVLMTSNIHYFSFKDLDLTGKVPFFAILLFMLIVVAIAWNPPWVLFAIFAAYTLSGPAFAIYRRRRRRQRQQQRARKIIDENIDTQED